MSPIRTCLIAALAFGLTTAVAGGTADPASSDVGQLDLTPPAVLESTAEFLAGWTAEQRANAVLQLELPLTADAAALATAREVEASWNQGQYATALETLRGLEATGLPVAMGVIWREPQEIGTLAVDSAIGNGREPGVKEAVDSDDGVLHALVQWIGQAEDFASWTMNVSFDGGVSWSETFMWWDRLGETVDADMIVVGGFVYIGYTPASSPSEGRMRRCLASDGGPDDDYSYQTVVDAGAFVLSEVSLASDADDANARIYYFVIESDSSLRFFWDVASDGTTFSEIALGIADASRGLSSTWDNSYTCSVPLFLSYVDSGDILHVGRILGTGAYEEVRTAPGVFGATTSISAYQNTVICAYLHIGTFGADVWYQISYDCGDVDTWNYGTLAEVQEGEGYYWSPSVTARGGQGTAAVYQQEVGEPDVVYLTTRSEYSPGPWAKPVQVNDHDVSTGSATALEWLPPVCFGRGYGFIYLSGNRTPYFDSAGSACPADTDGNRSVDFGDILKVLGNWGAFETDSRADTNCDGIVDFQDVLAILSNWGPCRI